MGKKLIISMNSVSKKYKSGKETIMAVDNISLDINRGDFMSICGVSGSGKTTLLNMLAGMIEPTEGSVVFNGKIDLAKMSESRRTAFRRRNIGMVFQDLNLVSNMTARENILFPLFLNKISIDSKVEAKLGELMKRLGIVHIAKRYPWEMSRGEQQRTAIARAIFTAEIREDKNAVLLADEPSGHLDAQNSEIIGSIFKSLNNDGRTIILATHDSSLAEKARTRFELYNGKLRFG